MQVDIRPLKQRLRNEIKAWRRELSEAEKDAADNAIHRKITRLREYKNCTTLLTYVSMPIEVDTIRLIAQAMADGKRVAVPRCVDGKREMEFYLITGMQDLAPRTFGVLEPIIDQCQLLEDFAESMCIVPALAYDRLGYRLGYGAGYYDRFLSGYEGAEIGVVYQQNLRRKLWHGRFDVPVDLIVTQQRLYVSKPISKED